MKRASLRVLSIGLGLLFLASCNGSSGGGPFLGNLPGQNTQLTFARMFDAICSDTKIYIIAPPFAVPLTPAGSFGTACHENVTFNLGNGNLAVSTGGFSVKSLRLYNPPYSSTSTPVATISGGATTFQRPEGVAWDGAGNVWVADQGSIPGGLNPGVKEFSPPFATGGPAPAATNTVALSPWALAINPVAGLMFIGDVGDNTQTNPGCSGAGNTSSCFVYVVPTPYTGVATATFTFPFDEPTAIAVDQQGRLFVGFSGGFSGSTHGLNGKIRVYVPPYATGNSPAFTLTASGSQGVFELAFDSSQNLYAQLNDGSVVMFTGPILGPIAAPSAVLGCPTGSTFCGTPGGQWGGLGFGP